MSEISAEIAIEEKWVGTDKLILGMCLAVSTYWLFALSMTAIIPTMADSMGVTTSELGLAVSITALMCGVFVVPMGSIADKFGRVKIAKAGVLMMILGAVICAVSISPEMLIVGRSIQGIAAAMIMPSTLAIVNAYYEGPNRLRALSFWSIASWGGGGLCSIFGGSVATYLGWQFTFWLIIPVAILSLILMVGTPESKAKTDSSHKFDTVGFVLLIVGLLCLNIALAKGSSLGWDNPLIIGGFVVAILALSVFFSHESRCKSPLVDLTLFKRNAYNGAVISNFMLNATLGALMILLTYVQQGRGLSPLDASLLTLGYTGAVLVMIRIGERLTRNAGSKNPMMIGCFLAFIGLLMPTLTMIQGDTYLVMVVAGLALMGVGLGVSATPSTGIAVGEAPPEKAGSASGIYKMASSLGGSMGLAISSVVYGAFISSGSSYDTAAAFGIGIAGPVVCLIALIAVATLVPKSNK